MVYGVAGYMVGTVNDTVVTMNVNTSASDSVFLKANSAQVLSGATGTVTKLLVKNGSKVNIGDVIEEG